MRNSSYRRPAWIEIDLPAIAHNLKQIRKMVGKNVAIMSVVKADAYGHGAIKASRVAIDSGIERLGVALPEELMVLREANITVPIHILSDITESAIEECVFYDAVPSINNFEIAKKLDKEAKKQNKRIKIHVKIDTGMSRSGIMPQKAVEFLGDIKSLQNVFVEGLLTHFATADKPGSDYTSSQAAKFKEVCDSLAAKGLKPPMIHASNSAATVLLPQYAFDMVRIGIMTYGLHPCKATKDKIDLKPAFKVKARISRIETVPKGTGVSYAATYIAGKDVKIATLPIGYGDGYSRLLSNRSCSIINGVMCRNVGNITMDQMMVELPDGLEAKTGDIATLIGSETENSISVDDISKTLGTINYEVTCMFTKRLPRIYID